MPAKRKPTKLTETEFWKERGEAEWSENNDVDPSEVSVGSRKPTLWKCQTCGGEWSALTYNRAKKGTGCPYCTGKKLGYGNDLASKNPDAALDWLPEENGGVLPSEVYYGTHKKANFTCHICGWKWSTSISHRGREKSGCPSCTSRHMPIEEVVKKVAAERSARDEKAARVDGREGASESLGRAKRRLLPKVTETEFWSEVGQHEWAGGNEDDPRKVSSGSTKPYLWRCSTCGGEWTASVATRIKGGGACQYCSGRKYRKGISDLRTWLPDIAAEWDAAENEIPSSEVFWQSDERGEFVCSECGHQWKTKVSNRTVRHSGCPECGRRRQAQKKRLARPGQSLADKYPEIAKELDAELSPLPADQIPYASNAEYPWVCPEHGTWWAKVGNRTLLGGGCPVCAGKVIQVGKNDLATTRPMLAAQWDYSKNGDLTPHDVTAGSSAIVYWICADCGHSWQQMVSQRAETNLACPKCRRKHEIAAIRNPLVETEWWEQVGRERWSDGNTAVPELLSAGSHELILWKCPTCGEQWWQSVRRAVRGEGGCPACGNRAYRAGVTDLVTKNPEVAADFDEEKNGIKASEVRFNERRRYWFKCHECGCEWETMLNARTVGGSGCPACATARNAETQSLPTPGVNDLASQRPDLAAELDEELSPRPAHLICVGSGQKYPWHCEKHGVWYTTPGLRSVGHGCPECGLERVIDLESRPTKGVNDLASQRPDLAAELVESTSPRKADEICLTSKHKYPWMCEKHGIWYASPSARVVGGTGCPRCRRSHGERDVLDILEMVGAVYTEQLWTSDCLAPSGRHLRFDFAIYRPAGTAYVLAAVIEYNGYQHYHEVELFGGKAGLKRRQENDQIKSEWCAKKGIPMLSIPYWVRDRGDMEQAILDFLRGSELAGARDSDDPVFAGV